MAAAMIDDDDDDGENVISLSKIKSQVMGDTQPTSPNDPGQGNNEIPCEKTSMTG